VGKKGEGGLKSLRGERLPGARLTRAVAAGHLPVGQIRIGVVAGRLD
jgi:hypothetical protein